MSLVRKWAQLFSALFHHIISNIGEKTNHNQNRKNPGLKRPKTWLLVFDLPQANCFLSFTLLFCKIMILDICKISSMFLILSWPKIYKLFLSFLIFQGIQVSYFYATSLPVFLLLSFNKAKLFHSSQCSTGLS